MTFGQSPVAYTTTLVRALEVKQDVYAWYSPHDNFRTQIVRNERPAPGAYLSLKIGTVWLCSEMSLAREFDWLCDSPILAPPGVGVEAFLKSRDFQGVVEISLRGVTRSPAAFASPWR